MPHRNRFAGMVALALALGSLAGCTSEGKPMSAENGPPPKKMETTPYNMPPKELLAEVKKVIAAPPISLPIEEENKGSLVTGYKQYPGTWHVARRWQERTRFRITVIADWDQPITHSQLQVSEDTQQRAAEIQEWQNSPDLQRQDRSAELSKLIQEQVQKTQSAK